MWRLRDARGREGTRTGSARDADGREGDEGEMGAAGDAVVAAGGRGVGRRSVVEDEWE